MIQFQESDHKYSSILSDDIEWISVTKLIHALIEPFDRYETAKKCSIKKPGKYPNKWCGFSVEEILSAWEGENNRSTELGHWYHSKRENELYNSDLQVIKPIISNGKKVASDQRLQEGIYPEHIVYLESSGVCGQVDKPEVIKGILNINDYKTNKTIQKKGFANWEGITKKMLKPVQHLDDCTFNHYSLQLSLYAYMILRHNPLLTLGKLTIEHVTFETESMDKYGYPITKLSDNKEPIIKDVTLIDVPYMLKEVQQILHWVKDPINRQKVING